MLSEGLLGKSATLKYHTVVQFHVSGIKKVLLAAHMATKCGITVVFAFYTNKFHSVCFLVLDLPLGPPWVTKAPFWDPPLQ